jgi:hypothetical protein
MNKELPKSVDHINDNIFLGLYHLPSLRENYGLLPSQMP